MKNLRIEIKWALIFMVVSLVWMALERAAGLHDEHIDKHATYTNLVAIPAIAMYVLAMLDKKRNYYNGVMTYKQGFMCGVFMTLFIAILSPLTQVITSKVITPDYYANASKYAVSQGMMSTDEAQSYFNLQTYILYGLVGALVMGLLTSAIVALFTRSRRAA